MKKFLVSLVAIALLLANLSLVACDRYGSYLDDGVEGLADFVTAQSKTSPTKASIETTVETAIGALNGTVVITYNYDGSSVIEYEYEQFNEINDEDEKSVISGTITCDKNGNYSGSIPGVSGNAASIKLILDASYMENIKVDKSTCRATVKASKTVNVFGVDLGADATLLIFKNGEKISSFSVAYYGEQGPVSIVCVYN